MGRFLKPVYILLQDFFFGWYEHNGSSARKLPVAS
jgi:hypothetical protein